MEGQVTTSSALAPNQQPSLLIGSQAPRTQTILLRLVCLLPSILSCSSWRHQVNPVICISRNFPDSHLNSLWSLKPKKRVNHKHLPLSLRRQIPHLRRNCRTSSQALTDKGENDTAEDLVPLKHTADRHFHQWTTLVRAEGPARTPKCSLKRG